MYVYPRQRAFEAAKVRPLLILPYGSYKRRSREIRFVSTNIFCFGNHRRVVFGFILLYIKNEVLMVALTRQKR